MVRVCGIQQKNRESSLSSYILKRRDVELEIKDSESVFIGECQDFTLPPCLSFTFTTSSPEQCAQLTPPMCDASLMYPPVTEGLLSILTT